MASAIQSDQLDCPICLSVFEDPVMLRCGHNFCWTCGNRVLDTQAKSRVYSCPLCREKFRWRPKLMRNKYLHNAAERFLTTQPDQKEITGICCTYCVDSPVPAVKSCLLCEASLCDKHLKTHNKSPEHVLSEPRTSLENMKCSVHKELLKYYCTKDNICICVSCRLVGEHRGHQVEMLEDITAQKKKKLRNFLLKQTIKREETEEIILSLEVSRRTAEKKASREATRVTYLFSIIRSRLEDLEKRVLSEISRQKEQMSLSLSALIHNLEKKKDELSRNIKHIEELCNMTDPLAFLREPDTGDLCDLEEGGGDEDTGGHDKQPHDGDDLDVAIFSDRVHTLYDIISGIRSGIYDEGPADILSDIRRGICEEGPADILLDVNTAHNNIIISDDLKIATFTYDKQDRPETAERFQLSPQVISSRKFYSGRHYWDIASTPSGVWMMGICYTDSDKWEQSYIGDNNNCWSLRRSNSIYTARHGYKDYDISMDSSSERFRICLDYEAGRLSFYELRNPIIHLYTFTATFTKPLHVSLWVREGSLKMLGRRTTMRNHHKLRNPCKFQRAPSNGWIG